MLANAGPGGKTEWALVQVVPFGVLEEGAANFEVFQNKIQLLTTSINQGGVVYVVPFLMVPVQDKSDRYIYNPLEWSSEFWADRLLQVRNKDLSLVAVDLGDALTKIKQQQAAGNVAKTAELEACAAD